MSDDNLFEKCGWTFFRPGYRAPNPQQIVRVPINNNPHESSQGIPAYCLDWKKSFWWRFDESELKVSGDVAPTDEVNHPAHYTQGDIECFDAIRAALTAEEFRGYLKGNIIKYIWRERMKKGVSKAQWYINKFIEVFGG